MKLLSDILYKCELIQVSGSTQIAVDQVAFDSRKVQKGALFVAVAGTVSDGHNFIDNAIDGGAVAVVCEIMPAHLFDGVTYIQVQDSSKALGLIAANFYGNPSEKLIVVGVTGTNGKTTIASLLHQVFQSMGFHSGLLSTNVVKIGNRKFSATHTTPDAVAIQQWFNKMVVNRCTHCFMEVSSHAVVQNRIKGIKFKGALFSNITHEHLDYHKTFRNYINAKKKLFDQLDKGSFAITNKDDPNGLVMLQNTVAGKYTFGIKTMGDYNGKVIENQLSGLFMDVDGREVWCKLVGDFNAYNIMAIYAACRQLGLESDQALTAISKLEPVEGRFQYFISKNKVTGIVDYAHTPDALENVLKTIQKLRTGNESVITVVGCGGNRDTSKRPLMASISASMSDKVILTSDNPRFEEPSDIIEDMKKGLDMLSEKKTLVVESRSEAIKVACSLSSVGDIILVAGKGHEKYQEIKGVRTPFDDWAVLKENLS
ncbi:MAG: UDP-N-acetylmuramoyl-L-alanyl-D-glutamate--2,6-diaminopimelate ligase [Bacteroidales bacterium]